MIQIMRTGGEEVRQADGMKLSNMFYMMTNIV